MRRPTDDVAAPARAVETLARDMGVVRLPGESIEELLRRAEASRPYGCHSFAAIAGAAHMTVALNTPAAVSTGRVVRQIALYWLGGGRPASVTRRVVWLARIAWMLWRARWER